MRNERTSRLAVSLYVVVLRSPLAIHRSVMYLTDDENARQSRRSPPVAGRPSPAVSASLLLLVAVAAAYVAAHVVFDWVARRFLIVSAAEYLLLGVLLGPQVAGIVGKPLLDSLAPVLTLALGWMGAIVGTQFELRRLLEIPAVRYRVAFAESFATCLVVGGLEFLVLRWTLDASIDIAASAGVAFGALAVVSSSTGIGVVSDILKARGAVLEQLKLSSSVNGFVGIAVLGLLFCIQHAAVPAERPLTPTEWAVVSIALGVIGGALFHLFIGDAPQPDRLFIALAGGVVLVSGAATYLRLSPLFAGFFFGLTLVNSMAKPDALVDALHRVEQPLYYILLVFGGAAWEPSQNSWLAPVAIFVIARAASKIGGARLAARANGALPKLGMNWGRALLGQGRLALAIGLNFLHQNDIGFRNIVFTAAVVSILLTEFFTARLARFAIEEAPDQAVAIGGFSLMNDVSHDAAAPTSATSGASSPETP